MSKPFIRGVISFCYIDFCFKQGRPHQNLLVLKPISVLLSRVKLASYSLALYNAYLTVSYAFLHSILPITVAVLLNCYELFNAYFLIENCSCR